jgi:hypothetical protein
MTRHGSPRGKGIPASKYRDHDERAVRMREVFVRICMVPGSGPMRGLVSVSYKVSGIAVETLICLIGRRKGDEIVLGLCFRSNNDAG